MNVKSSKTDPPNRPAVSQIAQLECVSAEELMSAYIDSMSSPEEIVRLESHVAHCAPCRSQLQSFVSLRNLIASVEPAEAPEDLVLDTRVKLSRARYRNYFDWIDSSLNNVLKPLAVPALFGVSLTALFFGVLFWNLVSNATLMAQDLRHFAPAPEDRAEVASDGNPTWNNPNVVELASQRKGLDEAITIGLDISIDGRVVDYNIISGRRSPAVDRWIKEVLCLARFSPATAFGKPVNSTIILTSVDIRG